MPALARLLLGISWLPPHLSMPVPWQVVALYGVMANVCDSFGFLAESLRAAVGR